LPGSLRGPYAPGPKLRGVGWTGARVAVAGACALVVGAAGVGAGLWLVGRDPARPALGAAPTATPTPTPTPPAEPAPVLADPTAGPPQTAAGVARALAAPLADPRLGGRVAATVLDAETGAVLLDRGGATPVVPASTAKLTTAVAVLSVTTPDQRLTTRVVAGARPGEVVLVGGGDATLSAAPAGTPSTYPGAARIATLAAAVRKKAGRVTRVVVDSSLFPGPAMAPSWDPVDVAGGYITPVTAAMVDAGRQPGRRARSSTPDLAAGTALAAALGVPTAPVTRGKAAAGAAVLAAVSSQPVPRLVETMLLDSDNVLAEALVRQVALAEGQPASFAGAAAATRAVLGRLGLPAGDRLVDGSGLSLQDRVTPALLAGLLQRAVSDRDPRLHALVPALPVAGYLGTLDDRYRTGPAALAAGQVRAKTGTLTGVSSLAGLVRGADGRLLAFAVVADRVPAAGTLGAEAALDDVAATLARCGC
jgi:serine-type D-Ala-D-Ala carboxypeptidase/endopeptidase (penicillin-binding protein 4)